MLLAGKGHEAVQKVGGHRRCRFDDREVASQVLQELRDGTTSGMTMDLSVDRSRALANGPRRRRRALQPAGQSTPGRFKSGDVFFAIAGPNHDGHDHIEAAFKPGARSPRSCRRAWHAPLEGSAKRASCFRVDEPAEALSCSCPLRTPAVGLVRWSRSRARMARPRPRKSTAALLASELRVSNIQDRRQPQQRARFAALDPANRR